MLLIGMGRQCAGMDAIGILDLAAPLADLRVELIAQDGEKPRREVRARREPGPVGSSLGHGLLNEVVGPGRVGGQGDREGA